MQKEELLSLESEAGFKALFQYATVGIIVVGRRGSIELVNPNAQELFGYGNAELVGQPLEILIPEHLKKKHVAHKEGYFNKPKARPMGKGMELFAQRKDGSVFPVEISLGNYELEGEMLAVAFITDITERKKAIEELKQLNESLEKRVAARTLELTHALEREKELNEMKTRFVSMASHEFRTPLSAILSSASLISQYEKEEQADKRKKHLTRIASSVKNLTDILNDFLSIDKLEQGKIEPEKHLFDFADFIADVIEEINSLLKTGQKLHHQYIGSNEIEQDRKILRNVLLNLLSNASKYSEENKDIHLYTEVQDHCVIIKVKDNGIGIPEDEQKNLFTKFYRAKNVSNIQGTGLGLNIVKRYVELMGGTICFTSNPEEGTTFIVEFPIK